MKKNYPLHNYPLHFDALYANWIKLYLDHCRYENNLSSQTIKDYQSELLHFFTWKENQ